MDLVSAHPWRSATFTTYALSLSFYEAVVLEALVRGQGRNSLILADVEGVRAALGEQGARRVGKDYDVEPIAVTGGVFHPKISVLSGDGECHVLVGSGNLTFGGWGGNLEGIEHLHPSFAADAIEDTADFFEHLGTTDRIRYGAHARCGAVAGDLRASASGRPRNGGIRLFHNLDGAILEKLAKTVDDLGGAVQLVAAAPFWDDGSAIDTLCTTLRLNEVFVHAHAGGTVEGTAGSNWPAHAVSAVHPIELKVLDEDKLRRLHAKLFEVTCKRGRVVLSGSANATNAALIGEHNVEACVARVQREASKGWTFVAAEVPELKKAQLAGMPSNFAPPPSLDGAREAWRRVQVRQLFRLSLEAIHYTRNWRRPYARGCRPRLTRRRSMDRYSSEQTDCPCSVHVAMPRRGSRRQREAFCVISLRIGYSPSTCIGLLGGG
jgi:hypothetical protein